MVTTVTVSRWRARMRAAVDRLHVAQLAALEESAAPMPPGDNPAPTRDAYGAERQVLAHLAEMGSLLVRLGGPGQADAESAETRRRVVTLAVACTNGLAELVSLAFEVEGAGETRREAGSASEAGSGPRGERGFAASEAGKPESGGEGGGHGSNG